VEALIESLRHVGLIQPIAIDERGTLLAGAHRLTAIGKLRAEEGQVYARWFPNDSVPVRVIALRGLPEPDQQALAVELSENEKRRNYTHKEIQQLVERLRSAGYVQGSGRLKPGKKHLAPALSAVMGRSLRTVRRLLADMQTSGPTRRPPERDPMPRALGRLHRAFSAFEAAASTLDDASEYGELSVAIDAARLALNAVYACGVDAGPPFADGRPQKRGHAEVKLHPTNGERRVEAR
jgi:hypothetical protein